MTAHTRPIERLDVMRRSKIESAMTEARSFLSTAHVALDAMDQDILERAKRHPDIWDGLPGPGDSTYGKTSGDLRRRSMDLTRALAEMRKP